MKNPTLVLKKNGKILFSSREPTLKPLVECIKTFSGRITGAELEDRVIGIAAARLITFSKMISRIRAELISEGALHHLSRQGISSIGKEKVAHILALNKKDICPMEKLSDQYPDDRLFYEFLLKIFDIP